MNKQTTTKTLSAILALAPLVLTNCAQSQNRLTEREQKYVDVLRGPLTSEQVNSLKQTFPQIEGDDISYQEAVGVAKEIIEKENKAYRNFGKTLSGF